MRKTFGGRFLQLPPGNPDKSSGNRASGWMDQLLRTDRSLTHRQIDRQTNRQPAVHAAGGLLGNRNFVSCPIGVSVSSALAASSISWC